MSLQTFGIDSPRSQPSSPSSKTPTRTQAPKLRYEAYSEPSVSPQSRSRRLSSGSSNLSLPSTSGRSASSDPLSQTVTPGDLTLGAGTEPTEVRTNDSLSRYIPDTSSQTNTREDLIAFDSPFLSDPNDAPPPPGPGPDFEIAWNKLEESNSGARGWCQGTSEEVIKKAVSFGEIITIGADEQPFTGTPVLFFICVDVRCSNASFRGG